jgi:alpha-beta hydrolase superfamily lysophospholipase
MVIVLKTGKWIVTVLAVLFLTIYFGRAFDARRMPSLGPEYRIEFEHEFSAAQEAKTDWQAYLAIEKKLATELQERIDSDTRPDSLVDRYSASSLTFPRNYPSNWNHSYEMSVPSPRGVAVLLHGLTDSPYSMLATAQVLAGAGYNVVVPRMPGHGFAVGGLLQARWEDWTAAVRIAVRHAMERDGSDESLLIVGYSNGGLLAVDYALQCDDATGLHCPNGLILMSPAIAVSPFAVVTDWHQAISWLPYFEKFRWLSILPEIDPFKFTSFPKRAAWEIYEVSKRTHERLAQRTKIARLPPVLTFQSVVDNTISARGIVTNLYARLPANGSDLLVYDINRNSTLLHLMKTQPADPVDYFQSLAPANFTVTILRNHDQSGAGIDALTLAAGESQPVAAPAKLIWPEQIYSLSHIAIPFRADDPLYGDGSIADPNYTGPVYGALAPRGEKGVLLLTSDFFLRTRYNPFFAFQSRYLSEWLHDL